MIEKIKKTIQAYHMLDKNDGVVMGVSGGADSVALFLALCRLKEEFALRLAVVHVNHGIRGEDAKRDAEYVERLCREYRLPFFLFEENIPLMAEKQGKSEEEMGREYRYQCFYQVMEETGADKLAVAHHMDDQAETVLFHLIRGAGLSGIRGMLPVNDRVIRPLMECRKEELEDWLCKEQISWREDMTNRTDVYVRNRLRNRVIPVLEDINAQAVAHICRMAEDMREYEQFFQQTAQEYINRNAELESSGDVLQSVNLKRDELISMNRVLAMEVLYELLTQLAGKKRDFSGEHVRKIYELMYKQSGKRISLPYQMEALISYENLIIRKCLNKKEEEWCCPLDVNRWLSEADGGRVERRISLPGETYLRVQVWSLAENSGEIVEIQKTIAGNSKNYYAKFFDCATIKGTLYIRSPRPEDYFVINPQGNRKKLSRYFKDIKLPANRRRTQLVVADDSEVLWVLGGRRSENYKIQDDTRHILVLTYEGETDELSY